VEDEYWHDAIVQQIDCGTSNTELVVKYEQHSEVRMLPADKVSDSSSHGFCFANVVCGGQTR
jgi:hypothetical protein